MLRLYSLGAAGLQWEQAVAAAKYRGLCFERETYNSGNADVQDKMQERRVIFCCGGGSAMFGGGSSWELLSGRKHRGVFFNCVDMADIMEIDAF